MRRRRLYDLRLLLASGGVAGILALGACATTFEEEAATPGDAPVLETGVLASNELNRLGLQDLAAGNSGLAERHFREAVEKNSEDGSSWLGLAAAYDKLGRFDLADRAYGQARRISGDTLPIINNLGYSYLLRGDRARALQQFERALRLDPANPTIRNNIAILRSGDRPNRGARP